ncbi:MAG TPA: SRPBCC family protein [Candidatus Dormibacteraeota bacterium]|nr:SRPBCC family protein [Candidatus Dormibacteraeota bacterium]
MTPARLVTIPAADFAFRADVMAAAARIPDWLSGDEAMRWLEAELRRGHPTAVVRAQEELARPYPDAEPVWYVFQRRYATRIEKRVSVPLPPERAFELYAGRVVEWQSAVELTPLRVTPELVGDEYDACYRLLGREFHGRFRIVDADPPRRLTTEAGGSGIRVWYVTRFSATAGGTLVSVDGDYELPDGVIGRIADRLHIERMIERDIESAHASFVALCEREAAAGAS